MNSTQRRSSVKRPAVRGRVRSAHSAEQFPEASLLRFHEPKLSISTGRCSLVGVAVSRLGLLAGLSTGTAPGPDADHSLQAMRRRFGVAIDLGSARPSVVPSSVGKPASEAAAVMDQTRAKFENSKTIPGVVAQSVRALQSRCLKNNDSGLQKRASKLPRPVVRSDRRRRQSNFSPGTDRNLMGSARLTEANP